MTEEQLAQFSRESVLAKIDGLWDIVKELLVRKNQIQSENMKLSGEISVLKTEVNQKHNDAVFAKNREEHAKIDLKKSQLGHDNCMAENRKLYAQIQEMQSVIGALQKVHPKPAPEYGCRTDKPSMLGIFERLENIERDLSKIKAAPGFTCISTGKRYVELDA